MYIKYQITAACMVFIVRQHSTGMQNVILL